MTPQPPSAGQTATATAATVAVPAATTAAGAAGAGVAAQAVPVLAGSIVAALISFLATLRQTHANWMRQNLGRYGQRTDIERAIAQETRFEDAFAQASADRLASSLPGALAITDPGERMARVRQLLAAEQRYAQQRSEAMIARAIAAVTRHALRRESPLGAFWRLGHAQNHTPGCKIMAGGDHAGAGRFWPWAVLDRVFPPRHYGCTSSLHGFGEAIAKGWMTPGDVPDERTAVRMAAGVMMEGDVERLLAELDVRDRLLELGVDTSGIPFEGVSERFDPAERRDRRGRWVAVAAALKRGEKASIAPAHVARLVDELADGSKSSLHLLEVRGHPNLFRANARGLSRAEMPQVPAEHLPGFMDFLRSKRVLATVEDVAPSKLQATQSQINGAAAAAIAKGWDPQRGGIMLISRDGHVLDGHHRWAAAALHELSNPSYRAKALRFSAGTDRMLALMREYNAQAGVRARAFGEGRVPGEAA